MMGHAFQFDPSIPENVNRYFPDEQPVHEVTLSSFEMSATPITQEQYSAITGDNPSSFAGLEHLPVTNVSANDALSFSNLLSEAEGLEPSYDPDTGRCDFGRSSFRLPTEAAWECACRAGRVTSV